MGKGAHDAALQQKAGCGSSGHRSGNAGVVVE